MTIKEICEKHGIGQSELARRLNIPLRTVQNWAGGQRKPPEYLPAMIDKILTYESEGE